MPIGLPVALRVNESFTGSDTDAVVVVPGGTTSVDVGARPLWARVAFTGTPQVGHTVGTGFFSTYFRVDALRVDDDNRLEILINNYYVICYQHTAGVVELLGEFNLYITDWLGDMTFDVQVSPGRLQVIVGKVGPNGRAIVVGPLYGNGSWPASHLFPSGTVVRADPSSTDGSAAVVAYLPPATPVPATATWVEHASDDDTVHSPNPVTLPWVIENGHLRDGFSGDYDQSFGGSGFITDGLSTYGRLDVDLYGAAWNATYPDSPNMWFMIAGVTDSGGPGGAWDAVTSLVVAPYGYAHMTSFGYAPGGGPASNPVWVDGDTFSAIFQGYGGAAETGKLQLLRNDVVYFEADVVGINSEGHENGTHVGVWAENYGYGPRGYGMDGSVAPLKERSISNFRWTSLPVLHLPPHAHLTVTPTSGRAPQAVSADASASTDGVVFTYNWGDGSPSLITSSDTASHTYTASYVGGVTVTVSNEAGSDTATAGVTILPPYPLPDISAAAGGVRNDFNPPKVS